MSQAAQKSKKNATAICPTRDEDFSEWYLQVVKNADLAEHSPVRGCMVIKPWGFGIWEQVRDALDKMIKDTGHENVYFPMFIPQSLIEKEAEHVDGFAKEMAVVTHTRLKAGPDGKLTPDGELEEPLIVRPTSETIIMEAFRDWMQSYRDLPILINQWANVVRMEMRPRLFLRTTEFLWQEGHTAHTSEAEARAEVSLMLNCYINLVRDFMAMPVIAGTKPAYDTFPGAVETQCIEAMMQDGKALQAGTSHYLGQNFATAANLSYQSEEGVEEIPHTTSWGVSTRLIGGLIMNHADDNGMRVPPKIAPYQMVIVPILRGENTDDIMAYCREIEAELKAKNVRVKVDARDYESQNKRWEWIKKGAPIIAEVGPKDLEKKAIAFVRRSNPDLKKEFMDISEFYNSAEVILEGIQGDLLSQAEDFLAANLHEDVTTLDDLKAFFNANKKGFVRAKWSEAPETEEILKEFGATIRCLPFDQSGEEGTCILTGQPATKDAIFAKSY